VTGYAPGYALGQPLEPLGTGSAKVMDVFLYRGVQGSTTAMAFFVSRTVCPFVSEVWEPRKKRATVIAELTTVIKLWFITMVITPSNII